MATTRWVRTPTDSAGAVEIGKAEYGDFLIRNHQFGARKITATPAELRAFIQAVKNGHFDRLLEEIK